MDAGDGLNRHFFNTWADAPLPPLFFDVPGTALIWDQLLLKAATTRAKIA